MSTLTRGDAVALVDEAYDFGVPALRYLMQQWGCVEVWRAPDAPEADAEELRNALRDFVDDLSSGDDQRSNGPRDSDDSGLLPVDVSCALLTQQQAHELVNAAAQMGALSHLAAAWDIAGYWASNAAWTSEQIHAFVAESYEFKFSDTEGLPVVNFDMRSETR